MIKRVAALAAIAAFLHAGAAAADTFYLTSPYQTVLPPPPLKPGASGLQTATETETPGHVSSRELITVGVGPDGTPVRVTATQRLRVHGTGDYSFTIPAPATRVARGADSESLPGLRDVGIVWQGFSTRERVLSATATLRPRDAAAGLPLRIALAPRGDATAVRLESVAHRRLPVLTGRAGRAQLDAVLRRLRTRLERAPIPSGLLSVSGEFGRTIQVEVPAPLHVTGTIGDRRVDELFGRGRPLTRSFVVRGTPAAVRLRVELLAPVAILPTPGELARAPRPVETLQTALGAIAISRAYARYLGSPDPVGASSATYVYRSAVKPAAAAPARRAPTSESNTLTVALIALLGVAGLCALAAVWARS